MLCRAKLNFMTQVCQVSVSFVSVRWTYLSQLKSHFCDGLLLWFKTERDDKKIAPSSSSIFFLDNFDGAFKVSGWAAWILVGMFETAIAPPVKAKLETTKPLPSLGNMFMSSVKITIQSTSFFELMFRQIKVDLKVQQTSKGKKGYNRSSLS